MMIDPKDHQRLMVGILILNLSKFWRWPNLWAFSTPVFCHSRLLIHVHIDVFFGGQRIPSGLVPYGWRWGQIAVPRTSLSLTCWTLAKMQLIAAWTKMAVAVLGMVVFCSCLQYGTACIYYIDTIDQLHNICIYYHYASRYAVQFSLVHWNYMFCLVLLV